MPAAVRGDAPVRNFDGVGCAGCGVTTCRRWHFAPTTDILDLLDLNGVLLEKGWMAELQEALATQLQHAADHAAWYERRYPGQKSEPALKQRDEIRAKLQALKDGKLTLGRPRAWFCTGKDQRSCCRTAKSKAGRVVEWDGGDLPAPSTLRTAYAGALAIAPHPEGASRGYHVVPAWRLRAATDTASTYVQGPTPPYTLADPGIAACLEDLLPCLEPSEEPCAETYRQFMCARERAGSLVELRDARGRPRRDGLHRLPGDQAIIMLPEECNSEEKLAAQLDMRFCERVGMEVGHVDHYIGYLVCKHSEKRCSARGTFSLTLPTREAFIEQHGISAVRTAIVEVAVLVFDGDLVGTAEGGWGSTIEVDMEPLLSEEWEERRLILMISVTNEFGFVHTMGALGGPYYGPCWAEFLEWKPEAECERLPMAGTPTRRSQRMTPAKKARSEE